ncbi:MAG: hypothetical protein PHF14_15140, partial [Verrucomicrobiota bacterium]|nr:hypothetical protein [Verrucomicrobiota bacterium]
MAFSSWLGDAEQELISIPISISISTRIGLSGSPSYTYTHTYSYSYSYSYSPHPRVRERVPLRCVRVRSWAELEVIRKGNRFPILPPHSHPESLAQR